MDLFQYLDKIVDFYITYKLGLRIILLKNNEEMIYFNSLFKSLGNSNPGSVQYQFPYNPSPIIEIENKILYRGMEILLINIDKIKKHKTGS